MKQQLMCFNSCERKYIQVHESLQLLNISDQRNTTPFLTLFMAATALLVQYPLTSKLCIHKQ